MPFTFFAAAGAISRLGAKPVFIDIRSDDFNMDPQLLERAITKRTKAIIPVHLFGQCADGRDQRDCATTQDRRDRRCLPKRSAPRKTDGEPACWAIWPVSASSPEESGRVRRC